MLWVKDYKCTKRKNRFARVILIIVKDARINKESTESTENTNFKLWKCQNHCREICRHTKPVTGQWLDLAVIELKWQWNLANLRSRGLNISLTPLTKRNGEKGSRSASHFENSNFYKNCAVQALARSVYPIECRVNHWSGEKLLEPTRSETR